MMQPLIPACTGCQVPPTSDDYRDPWVLFHGIQVRGFDPNVSEATFDPLANRRAAVAAANGASMGPGAGAGGGGWPGTGFGGHGPGFTAGPQGSSEDAAAVLQLGMQLEVMNGT